MSGYKCLVTKILGEPRQVDGKWLIRVECSSSSESECETQEADLVFDSREDAMTVEPGMYFPT